MYKQVFILQKSCDQSVEGTNHPEQMKDDFVYFVDVDPYLYKQSSHQS